MTKKEDHIFNPGFKDLDQKIKQARGSVEDSMREKPKAIEPDQEVEDDFLAAMADVIPLQEQKTRIIRPAGPNVKPTHPAPDDVKETMAQLSNLVRGAVELDITFSDEYIEGSVKGFGRKMMKRLKRGQIPVQDHIDLHGMTRQEAEKEVKAFILRSHRLGLRCVLIVHGRGLNSPESLPVLKEGLPRWLRSGPVKKIVLAFATARPYDGGTGAVYVLLKRR